MNTSELSSICLKLLFGEERYGWTQNREGIIKGMASQYVTHTSISDQLNSPDFHIIVAHIPQYRKIQKYQKFKTFF